MKKITLLLLSIFSVLSCSDDDAQESYSFYNNTEYNVIVKPFGNLLDGAPNFEFPINAGERATYNTEYFYGAFQVASANSGRNFSYQIQGNDRVIYSFDKMVRYRITGSATSANLTYSTSGGGTYQQTVTLPYDVDFNYFGSDFKYISAQNNTNYGAVKVEIFYMDSLVETGFCSGEYCIATASFSN